MKNIEEGAKDKSVERYFKRKSDATRAKHALSSKKSNEPDSQDFARFILVYKEQSMHAAINDNDCDHGGRAGGACERYFALA